MKRHWTHLTILAIGASLLFFGLTMAQGKRPFAHEPGFRVSQRIMRAVIKPTPEQQEEIRAIRSNYRPQLKAARENLRAIIRALQDALLNPDTSDLVVKQRIEAVAAARSELTRLRANMRLEVNKVLTPEQLAKLKEFRDKRQNLRKEFRQRRRALIKEFTESDSN